MDGETSLARSSVLGLPSLTRVTLRSLSYMAKHGKLQIALEYALARASLSGLGVLPRQLAITVGLSIGRLAYLLPGNLHRTGRRNLEIAFPEMPQAYGLQAYQLKQFDLQAD